MTPSQLLSTQREGPTAADRALATAWVDDVYRLTVDAGWFADRRDKLIRHAAMAEMQKREHREWREAADAARALGARKRRAA